MAVTTAEREAVRKRAAAAGKTSTTAGINATVAKYRAAPVVPPVAAVEKVTPPVVLPAATYRREGPVTPRPTSQGPQPNANAIANANPNARFKRTPEATAWVEGLRTAMKAARGTYSTANPKPAGVKGRRRGRAKK